MSKERELLQEVLNKSYFIKDTVMEGIFNRIEELLAQQEELTREPLSDEHLISAAPELLEALENWINALDDPSEWMKCRDDAKKAIEKAHGIGAEQ